jgi:2-polyprenyl-3-methyl-5-hydroxy-6-metoxy-1,4-benzoquinol methylase
LLALLDAAPPRRVLDVGCGAGDNAALLRERYPGVVIDGITRSHAEAELAAPHLDRRWIFDVERPVWPEIERGRYDALIFSHVLEHLREPSRVLARFARLLGAGGSVYVAVPNVLSWRQRLLFLRGRFEYTDSGVLDSTHLRFFTYLTAAGYLFGDCPELELVEQRVIGSVPLWWLRRRVLPSSLSLAVDALGCRLYPNLFGAEILLKASKR